MENEIWKNINDRYQVSNLGNVRSVNYMNTGIIKLLKQFKSYNGYIRVGLSIDGKLKNLLVHRLVAQAFIPNPNNLPQINHKDEDKTNNVVGNLEWCDQRFNNEYGSRNERSTNSNRNNPKQNCRKVNQYTLDGIFVNSYPSLSEIKRSLGFDFTNIQACCSGRHKTAYGYVWRYAS